MRLSPLDPMEYLCILGIGTAHFAARRCALIHNLTLRYRKGAIRLSMRVGKVWKARANLGFPCDCGNLHPECKTERDDSLAAQSAD
jgi:hypothetical protein